MLEELRAQGYDVGRKRVARLMAREDGRVLGHVDYEDRYWERRAAAQLGCLPGRGKTTRNG